MALDPRHVRCQACELVQYLTGTATCRRCKSALHGGSVEGTTVILLDSSQERQPKPVHTLRVVMQMAVVAAVRQCGGTTKAAAALDVPHERVKKLLRESGDEQDYRKGRKARKLAR